MRIVKKNVYYCEFCKKKSLACHVKEEVKKLFDEMNKENYENYYQ